MAQIPVLFHYSATRELRRAEEVSQVSQSHQNTDPDLSTDFHLYVPHEYDWQSGKYPVA